MGPYRSMLNAVGITRLVLMKDGYKTAADLMVEAAASDRLSRDTLVFPIIFNYRQFLELSLKYQLATFGPEVGIKPNWKSHDSYQRPPDLTQGDSHERRDLIQWHQGKGGFDGSKDYAQRQVRRRASPGSGAVPGWESGATDVGDCPGSGWG